MENRIAKINRKTNETDISLEINLDGLVIASNCLPFSGEDWYYI